MSQIETSRRNIIQGVAAAGVAVPVLAACGSDDGGTDATGSTPTDQSSPTSSSSPGGNGDGGIPTADIPVGGGEVFDGEGIVVTQPTAGEFKAFSAVCTHRGCNVGSVSDGKILCPCHGSQYSIEDGSVVGGPAPAPLSEKTVTVNGDSLTVS